MMTQDLYTVTDVKRVRERLFQEQGFCDALSGLDLPPEKACLDHDHTSQYVRGVLHRNVNALAGVAENNYRRHLASWWPYDLPTFLRFLADYLEKEPDTRWYHLGWQKKVNVMFNKLNEAQKDQVLIDLCFNKGSNGKERKETFKSAVLDRRLGFEKIRDAINNVRENTH